MARAQTDPLSDALNGAQSLARILSNSVLPCTPAQADAALAPVVRFLNAQAEEANAAEQEQGQK